MARCSLTCLEMWDSLWRWHRAILSPALLSVSISGRRGSRETSLIHHVGDARARGTGSGKGGRISLQHGIDCVVNFAEAGNMHFNMSKGMAKGHETCTWDGMLWPGKWGVCKEAVTVSGCGVCSQHRVPKADVWALGRACPNRGGGFMPCRRDVIVPLHVVTPGRCQPISVTSAV